MDFTDPYYNSQQAFTVNTDLNPFIDGTEDLGEGDSVGVQTGTTGAAWATDNLGPPVSRFGSSPRSLTPSLRSRPAR